MFPYSLRGICDSLVGGFNISVKSIGNIFTNVINMGAIFCAAVDRGSITVTKLIVGTE